MALFKEKITDNGIVSKYHRVSLVTIRANELLCNIESFATKEYRDKGCEPVGYDYYIFECSTEMEESMGARQLCYKLLKELPEWFDAEDC